MLPHPLGGFACGAAPLGTTAEEFPTGPLAAGRRVIFSAPYEGARSASNLPREVLMATPQLTPRTLSSIATDLVNGRPLWGLLRLNEMAGDGAPLHRALLTRARRALTEAPPRLDRTLTQKILAGTRLAELTPSERRIIRSHERDRTAAPRRVIVRAVPYKIRRAGLAPRRVPQLTAAARPARRGAI